MSKTYGQSEKFKIGCRAITGASISDISKDSGMSREYIYQQKEKLEKYAASLDEKIENAQTLEIDKAFKERTIVSLALDCGSSLEGIQRFFNGVYKTKISIGCISGVLKKSSRKSAKV